MVSSLFQTGVECAMMEQRVIRETSAEYQCLESLTETTPGRVVSMKHNAIKNGGNLNNRQSRISFHSIRAC